MRAENRKIAVTRAVDRLADEADALAGELFTLAEPPFREHRSAARLADFLARHGFRVRFCFPNLPTAFRAERGAGRPRIGILGEYDALPDCGARAGEWGHGCGHNLLGAGSAAAGVAAAEVLARRRRPGTIVYYGCPAEELLAGKAYLARDGAFRDLDACIAWHPGAETRASYAGGAALDSWVYEFFGKTCHAAYPVGGRSALDAAILFDVAVNYLRESVPENVRIHAVIEKGGDAPNVVPAYARSWYYLRGKDRAQVDEVRARVDACARGAAIATGTRVRRRRTTAIYSRLPNDALFELVDAHLRRFGTTPVRPEDVRRARRLGLKGEFARAVEPARKDEAGRASSDEDTVSRLTPLCLVRMATHARGTAAHHRLFAAQSALPFALRGMRQAAKVIAGVAVDLVADPGRLRRVRAEFRRRSRGFRFDPLIPRSQRVPAGDPPDAGRDP